MYPNLTQEFGLSFRKITGVMEAQTIIEIIQYLKWGFRIPSFYLLAL